MTIVVKQYELVKTSNGWRKFHIGNVLTFPNEKVEEVEDWRVFLENYRTPTGKKLPRKSALGTLFAYHVYIWGTPMKYRLHKHNNVLNLFPGYDSEGKAKRIIEHGRLRD